ncbi:MAG: hypothetical protein ACR2MN_07275 [Acidimicrobiales bacterium]
MNAADLLAAARAAGAEFRLGHPDRLQSQRFDRLPLHLKAGIRVQRASVIAALHAEVVARSPLPWRRQGPGWLAIINPDPTGDGTRLHATPIRAGWALTIRPPGEHPTVIVARGTLATVLAAAEDQCPTSARTVAS